MRISVSSCLQIRSVHATQGLNEKIGAVDESNYAATSLSRSVPYFEIASLHACVCFTCCCIMHVCNVWAVAIYDHA